VLPRTCLLLPALLLFVPSASAQAIQIGVLGLFHPRELVLRPARGETLVVTAAGKSFVLDFTSRAAPAHIQIFDSGISLDIGEQVVQAGEIRAAGRGNGSAAFVLAVPGRITRAYRGTLVIKATARGELVAIVAMDLETAVASAVQAESASDAPLEALKAQAVVARSYYVAGGGRHRDFDFCDLTHCQFLCAPPDSQSPAAQAARATRDMVLTYEERTFAAMFSQSCGGRTRTPAELGLPSKNYPYFLVVCDYCYQEPVRWTRRISHEDAELLRMGEAGRLAVDRRLGWNAIPSNNFTARAEDGEVVLEGTGQGHGIGLCQRGAQAMAASGATFREILAHYFPNTKVAAAPATTTR
jgi:hypothetical protein